MKKPLSIYVHIPFCIKKCLYCDFLSAPDTKEAQDAYGKAMLAEIEHWGKKDTQYVISTVYFGGGTPSVIDSDWIKKALCKLRESFSFAESPEISIEINPGTVTREKLGVYQEAGINRLSIGLQSADKEELKRLGRIHGWEDFLSTYNMAREEGFANINVDLMNALPGQTLESYVNTLHKVITVSPEHISAYSLIVEEGTPFYKLYGPGEENRLPDEETDRNMYIKTKQILEQAGYKRYEISNYAKEGFACRHNLVYWNRHEYLGIGLGASSLLSESRFNNITDLNHYLETATGFGLQMQMDYVNQSTLQRLTKEEQMAEFMFLGLRLTEGVSRKRFFDCFREDMFVRYGDVIEKYESMNFMRVTDYVCLTEDGMFVSNVIMADFLL